MISSELFSSIFMFFICVFLIWEGSKLQAVLDEYKKRARLCHMRERSLLEEIERLKDKIIDLKRLNYRK